MPHRGEDRDTAATRLDRVLAVADPWPELERLVADSPPGLIEAIRDRYRDAPPQGKRRDTLTYLLGLLARRPRTQRRAVGLIIALLATATGDDAADLLRQAVSAKAVVPEEELTHRLDPRDHEPAVVGAAIDAAGVSGHPTLAPLLRVLLGDRRFRAKAAIALGRMRATAYTGEIVDLLPGADGLLEHRWLLTALEVMDDRSVVASLRDWLDRAPQEWVHGVHSALIKLTGREPVLPLGTDLAGPAGAAAIRRAWPRADALTGPLQPRLTDVKAADDAWRGGVRLIVRDGLGRIRIDRDPPAPGSAWPIWSYSLRVGGERIYEIPSVCDTCELMLTVAGWPSDRSARLSRRLRAALRDLPVLTAEVVAALEPLLCSLRSGHYLLMLADLDVEHVTSPEDAWWSRRVAFRGGPDEAGRLDDAADSWPGTDHFQLRGPLTGPCPSFVSVLPTAPLGDLSADTVARYTEDIDAGRRPAAVLMTWADDRHIQAEWRERFLVNVVLDGHHKLMAYARRRVPARAVLVCRIGDSWGTPDEPTRHLHELTAPLRLRRPPEGLP